MKYKVSGRLFRKVSAYARVCCPLWQRLCRDPHRHHHFCAPERWVSLTEAGMQAGRQTPSLWSPLREFTADQGPSPLKVLGIRLKGAAGATGIRRVSSLKGSSSLRGFPRPGLHCPGAVMREESALLSVSDWLLTAVFSLYLKHLVWEAVCLMDFLWEKLKAASAVTQRIVETSDILKWYWV